MRVRRNELFGYLSIVCLMSFYSLDKWKENADFLYIGGLVFGLLSIFLGMKIKYKTLLVYLLLAIIPLFCYMHSMDARIPVMLIGMLCGLKMDMHKVVCVMFYTKLVCYFLMLAVGGFGHINGMALHGGILILLYLCKNEKNFSPRKMILAFLSYIVIFLYSNTGTLLVSIGVALLLVVLIHYEFGRKLCSSVFVMWIYPICLLFYYLFVPGVLIGEIPWIGKWLPDAVNAAYALFSKWLDGVMSYRLTLVAYSWQQFGVSLWGGNVNYNKLNIGQGGYFNLDSGLMWLVQGGGILLTIIFMILSVILMRYLIREKHYCYVIAGITIALWAISEEMLQGIGTNFLIFFMGKAVVDFVEGRRHREHTKKNPLLLVRRRRAALGCEEMY